MVAHLEGSDAQSHRLNHAGGFVAATVRKARERDVPGGEVIIRVAQTRRHHPDQHLMILRPIEIGLDHLPLPGCSQKGLRRESSWSLLEMSRTVLGWHGDPNCAHAYFPRPEMQRLDAIGGRTAGTMRSSASTLDPRQSRESEP